MELIDRQAAIDAINASRALYSGTYGKGLSMAVEKLRELPPAQPERIKARWIRTGSGSLYDHYQCTRCGKAPKWELMGDNNWHIAFTDFCPNCGADMRGEVTE